MWHLRGSLGLGQASTLCTSRDSCSDLQCSDHCMYLVDTTHKFYLSLENSICKLNGVDMSTVAPPNSSIDIKDFPSFEGLSQRQCWILLFRLNEIF